MSVDLHPALTSRDPATGEIVGVHPVHRPADVQAAVTRAGRGSVVGGLGFDRRRTRLLAWKGVLARRGEELAELVHRENGKPVPDAHLEVALAITHLDWAARRARRVLGPRRVPAGLLMLNQPPASSTSHSAWSAFSALGTTPSSLPSTRVRDRHEAVERANDSVCGLASAVFSARHGMDLARRLRSGITSVNSVSFAAVPALPFGGVGESGFGRIHGPDGLREFTRAKAITRQRFATPLTVTTFTPHPAAAKVLSTAVRLLHGRH